MTIIIILFVLTNRYIFRDMPVVRTHTHIHTRTVCVCLWILRRVYQYSFYCIFIALVSILNCILYLTMHIEKWDESHIFDIHIKLIILRRQRFFETTSQVKLKNWRDCIGEMSFNSVLFINWFTYIFLLCICKKLSCTCKKLF